MPAVQRPKDPVLFESEFQRGYDSQNQASTSPTNKQIMNMKKFALLLTAGALAASGLTASAANWPHWRGPKFNGSSPESGLPSNWSKKDNVVWITELPGESAATPAIWEDRVYVSSIHDATLDLMAMCLDRKTGKILWQHVTGSGFGGDDRSNKASPSPVTNGETSWFYYGSGDLVSFDKEGNKIWARNIQDDYGRYAFLWTYSSSPTLYEGRLYIPVMQRDWQPHGGNRGDKHIPSFLLCLDPNTGETLWKQERPSKAVAESREAFTTPIPVEYQGRKEIVLAGGDALTGHHPMTGEELWRWGTWNPTRIDHWRLVASSVFGNGIHLVCAPKKDPIYAIQGGAEGDVSDDPEYLAWKSESREVSSDVATPLFYKGRFYVLNGERKSLSCVVPQTGEVKWSAPLDSRAIFRASPTGADGKIYCMNHNAEVFVVEAADEFNPLAKIDMGDGDTRTRSTIAVAQGQLFIRTKDRLYCIEKGAGNLQAQWK